MLGHGAQWGVGFAALLLAGCPESSPLGGDPQVGPGVGVDGGDPGGGPAVQLGYFYELTYDPFEDGDDCPIFYALQGGSWTMPAVRLWGFRSPVRLVGSLVTEAGETLGEIDKRQSFNDTIVGWIEIKRLPIPAQHEAPNTGDPIDDLFGQSATLSLSASDDEGHTASHSVEVILVDNPIL